MDNSEVSARLYKMAEMLEFQGENPFKIRAYIKAARNIKNLDEDVNKIFERGELEDIPGVGKAIAGKVEEMLKTGTFEAYERLNIQIPVDVGKLMEVPEIGPRTLQLLYQHLGVESLEDLKEAAEAHRIRRLPRMGAKQEERILNALKSLDERSKLNRIPIGRALPIAEEIQNTLDANPHIQNVVAAGSIRRRKDNVGDIDFIATSTNQKNAIYAFTHMEKVQEILGEGTTKGSIIYDGNIQVDLRIVNEESFGSLLQHFTGSKEHNIRLRDIALSRGLRLSEYGFTDQNTGNLHPCRTEEEVYRTLGLDFIPPELREDRGEVEAALSVNMPHLITIDDIKGDLHVHSNWSDGKNTILEMAEAARGLGYSYIAICDHSKSRAIAGGLSEKRLIEHVSEIETINEEFDDFRVLSGVECDIKANASLDYSSDILEGLDLVIAAIHSGFNEDRKTLTKRMVSAIENEHVDIIAHPTGRLLGERDAYELDMNAVLQTARDNNKVLEINAFPERLDLNDINARSAKEMCISLAINTDAHHTSHYKYMSFGVDVARRAWLEPDDVVNTLELDKLCKLLGIEKH
ncbi:MAG: DNA polymerase/3'-5' exonuclease PolX [Methanosarcinaceae archaeon]|nr:DNA polymerase/3'-5' exonuclease PolX [Methanosarcinaceae archaeon]